MTRDIQQSARDKYVAWVEGECDRQRKAILAAHALLGGVQQSRAATGGWRVMQAWQILDNEVSIAMRTTGGPE